MALNLSSLANTLLIGCLLLILSSGVSTLQLINFHTFRTSLLKSKCAVSKSETMTLCVCNAVKSNRSLWGLSAGWEECYSPSSSPSQRQPSTVIGQLTQQTVTPSGWQLMLSQPCSQSSLLTSWMYLKTESHRLYLSTLSFFPERLIGQMIIKYVWLMTCLEKQPSAWLLTPPTSIQFQYHDVFSHLDENHIFLFFGGLIETVR